MKSNGFSQKATQLFAIVFAFQFLTFCMPRKDRVDVFDPIGLEFLIHYEDSSAIIYFRETDSDVYANYIEVKRTRDYAICLFYAIIDNTEGNQTIKYLIFDDNTYLDFHVRDYRFEIYQYTGEPDSIHRQLWDDYTKDRFPRINIDSLPRTFIAAEFLLAPYSKNIGCNLWNLGRIVDLDEFLEPYVSSDDILTFSEMKDTRIVTDYKQNMRKYGKPAESGYAIVTDENRKQLFRRGWLFLDTLKLKDDTKIAFATWEIKDSILTIYYRNDVEGKFIPINGARYMKHMKTFDWKINYK